MTSKIGIQGSRSFKKKVGSTMNTSEKLDAAMEEIRSRAAHFGAPSLRNGVLHFGETSIPRPDYEIVTEVQTSHGCTASIFVRQGDDFVRAATNIFRDGDRAVDTLLDPNGPVIGPVRAGDAYRGPADILGVAHDTYYEPIFDDAGEVIGTFLVGFPQEDQ